MVGPEDTALIFHSWTTHRKYLTHLKEAFNHHNANHAIAVKTNPHPAILAQLVDWGFGLECASMEEVYLALQAGCPGPKIVFDSPVKTKHEIRICHENPDLHGILVNVNSLGDTSEPRGDEGTATMQHGRLSLNLDDFTGQWDETQVVLTLTEFGILRTLMQRPGKVYSRDDLMSNAYELSRIVSDRTIDSHVRRVRKKFADIGAEPVETVHGIGYKLGAC